MNKQIEEMAFDLCRIDTCKHLKQEECNKTTCAHCEAEALYNAGYRKQSEGEWLPSDTIRDDSDGRDWILFFCSACETNSPVYYKENEDLPNFCPNCGARMKGEQ